MDRSSELVFPSGDFAQRAAENIIARKKQEKPYVTYDHTIVYLEGSIGAKDKLARYTNHRPDISIDKSACADGKIVAVRTVAEHSATPAKECPRENALSAKT